MTTGPEETSESLRFEFQWHVDDLPVLQQLIAEDVSPSWNYAIVLVSRVVAYALTFMVAWLMLPGVELMIVFLIALTGSLSIWVAVFTYKFLLRNLHRMEAMDSMKVGWVHVSLDATGILRNTDLSQTYHSWFSVSEVREINGAIWIKLGRASGEFLPARVFDQSLTAKDTLKQIAKYRAAPSEPLHQSPARVSRATKH